jgi:hypothetical protein
MVSHNERRALHTTGGQCVWPREALLRRALRRMQGFFGVLVGAGDV